MVFVGLHRGPTSCRTSDSVQSLRFSVTDRGGFSSWIPLWVWWPLCPSQSLSRRSEQHSDRIFLGFGEQDSKFGYGICRLTLTSNMKVATSQTSDSVQSLRFSVKDREGVSSWICLRLWSPLWPFQSLSRRSEQHSDRIVVGFEVQA